MVGRLMKARRVRGSALTEFALLLVVMVPLMAGIPMIGKMIDLKQNSVQASRYVAWESTVTDWETTAGNARRPTDVQARFFADNRTPLKSTAVAADDNPLWGSGPDNGAGLGGLPSETRVAIDESRAAAMGYVSAYGDGVGEGIAHATGDMVRKVGRLVDDKVGGDWDITADGLLKGGVSVDFQGNDWVASAIIKETSVIMNDGWSAADDGEAATRARSFVPVGALEEHHVEKVLVTAGKVKPLQELKGLKGAFGHVDMTQLPESEQGERRLRDWDEVR